MAENMTQKEDTTNTQNGDATKNQSDEKLFTQAELNRIIQERLAKERSKQRDPENLSLEERERLITERENRFTCREILTEKKMSERLLDVLDTSSPEKFRTAINTIQELYCPNAGKDIPRVVGYTPGIMSENEGAGLRKAFGLSSEKE